MVNTFRCRFCHAINRVPKGKKSQLMVCPTCGMCAKMEFDFDETYKTKKPAEGHPPDGEGDSDSV